MTAKGKTTGRRYSRRVLAWLTGGQYDTLAQLAQREQCSMNEAIRRLIDAAGSVHDQSTRTNVAG